MSKSKSPTPMTTKAAARMQSTEAKANGGKVSTEGVAARVMRAAAKNSKQ